MNQSTSLDVLWCVFGKMAEVSGISCGWWLGSGETKMREERSNGVGEVRRKEQSNGVGEGSNRIGGLSVAGIGSPKYGFLS